jgi:uroporphyrinogen-III synthase
VPSASFQGLRVLSLESRRSREVSRLIETYQGVPLSAPAMREVSVDENREVLGFARDVIDGSFDFVVFFTGVGARIMLQRLAEEGLDQQFLAALRKIRVAVRGPKPQTVLREWSVPIAVAASEPHTWRELLASLDESPGGLAGKRIAVQEYGASNPEFLAALRERGAAVRAVSVYEWALPEDLSSLREAVAAVIAGQVDVALFTTGVQIRHFFQVAREMDRENELRRALAKIVVASIGPSTSAALEAAGLRVDLVPAHSKLGVLVKEAAERSNQLISSRSKE